MRAAVFRWLDRAAAVAAGVNGCARGDRHIGADDQRSTAASAGSAPRRAATLASTNIALNGRNEVSHTVAQTIAIIDYGSGNLHSAAKAFERAATKGTLKVIVEMTNEQIKN